MLSTGSCETYASQDSVTSRPSLGSAITPRLSYLLGPSPCVRLLLHELRELLGGLRTFQGGRGGTGGRFGLSECLLFQGGQLLGRPLGEEFRTHDLVVDFV